MKTSSQAPAVRVQVGERIAPLVRKAALIGGPLGGIVLEWQ